MAIGFPPGTPTDSKNLSVPVGAVPTEPADELSLTVADEDGADHHAQHKECEIHEAPPRFRDDQYRLGGRYSTQPAQKSLGRWRCRSWLSSASGTTAIQATSRRRTVAGPACRAVQSPSSDGRCRDEGPPSACDL
jgi:hypothetical protein